MQGEEHIFVIARREGCEPWSSIRDIDARVTALMERPFMPAQAGFQAHPTEGCAQFERYGPRSAGRMPAFEHVKESHFCVWRGPKSLSLAPCGEGGSGGESAKSDDLVSASWGFDPQTAGAHEVVGERMPERMSLSLDEPANWEKTKAMPFPASRPASSGRRCNRSSRLVAGGAEPAMSPMK